MELQLKDLVLYLPYNLKVEVLDYKCDYVGKQYDQVLGIHQWDRSCKFWSVLTFGGAKPDISKVKPILRPLSDLDNLTNDYETEHSINLKIEEEFDLEYGVFCPYGDELSIDLDGDSSVLYDSNKSISFKVIERIQELLLSSHYDISRLIAKGLAIDINTIK